MPSTCRIQSSLDDVLVSHRDGTVGSIIDLYQVADWHFTQKKLQRWGFSVLMRCEDQIHVAANLRHHFSAGSFASPLPRASACKSQFQHHLWSLEWTAIFGIESVDILTQSLTGTVIGLLGQVHSEVDLLRLCSLIREGTSLLNLPVWSWEPRTRRQQTFALE